MVMCNVHRQRRIIGVEVREGFRWSRAPTGFLEKPEQGVGTFGALDFDSSRALGKKRDDDLVLEIL
jgi:hypothetical protein